MLKLITDSKIKYKNEDIEIADVSRDSVTQARQETSSQDFLPPPVRCQVPCCCCCCCTKSSQAEAAARRGPAPTYCSSGVT